MKQNLAIATVGENLSWKKGHSCVKTISKITIKSNFKENIWIYA